MQKLWIGLAFAIFVCLMASSSRAEQAATEQLYKSKCAMCHGVDGKGQTPVGQKLGAHDFASAEVQKQSDADLAQIIQKGKNKMPAYDGKLKPEEIKDLVGYIRKFGK
ncbi:MAG TPA: cytochrome c [Terriglobales bacterium]|nr:cytochrome c [Terriglobales bacterium]